MILVDLNVLLDVIQQREPHFRASGAVLEEVVAGRVAGGVPVHALTTVHFLVNRYANRKSANRAVDWILQHFSVLEAGYRELLRARALDWPDFEDAVVAAVAERSKCACIVTRNVRDFRNSPVAALTPEEYLLTSSGQ